MKLKKLKIKSQEKSIKNLVILGMDKKLTFNYG